MRSFAKTTIIQRFTGRQEVGRALLGEMVSACRLTDSQRHCGRLEHRQGFGAGSLRSVPGVLLKNPDHPGEAACRRARPPPGRRRRRGARGTHSSFAKTNAYIIGRVEIRKEDAGQGRNSAEAIGTAPFKLTDAACKKFLLRKTARLAGSISTDRQTWRQRNDDRCRSRTRSARNRHSSG